MKKILFLMDEMRYGGNVSALLNLLRAMDRADCEITLLLLRRTGECLNLIPDSVMVRTLPLPPRMREWYFGERRKRVKSLMRKGRIQEIPGFILRNFNKKALLHHLEKLLAYLEKNSEAIPCLEGEYDLAVDYSGYAHFTTWYLAEKIRANTKAAWIHMSRMHEEVSAFGTWYDRLDRIFACSEAAKRAFLSACLTGTQVDVFYNMIDPSAVRARAGRTGGFDDDFCGVRILTVGRILPIKGMDLAAKAYQRLLTDGFLVRWYIIGDGTEEEKKRLRALLKTQREKENFILMGFRDNPCIYMKQCDIYVQPSRSEAYGIAIQEALTLGCVVVATDAGGVGELMEDGKTGFLVDVNEIAISAQIETLISRPALAETVRRNLENADFSNQNEIRKLYALLHHDKGEDANGETGALSAEADSIRAADRDDLRRRAGL